MKKTTKKIKMFGKNINAKYNCTKTNSLSVTENTLQIRKSFAFPYVDGNATMKNKGNVTFAILNYDDASNLIGRSKINKDEYKAYLDSKAKDKV
mgnify:FL=1